MSEAPQAGGEEAALPGPDLRLEDVSPEGLMAFYAERGWGDGLPMIPPTEARVAAMLGDAGGPDAVVATLPPRFGVATRRILAVNAVLAGCAPAHFEVLVAAVRRSTVAEFQAAIRAAHPSCPAPCGAPSAEALVRASERVDREKAHENI